MDPTSLERILQTGFVTLKPNGLEIIIPPQWIINGENRLSYTSITRLVECCREYHWSKDIIPVSCAIDSICKTISARFDSPVFVNSTIQIIYRVEKVGGKSYTLSFQVYDNESNRLCALFKLVSVFYDPEKNVSHFPPASINEMLSKMARLAT